MSLDGHQTCPHCRAIVSSTICSICGKTAFEEVAAPVVMEKRSWRDSFENGELRKLGIGLLVLTVLVTGIAFVLTRPDPTTVATALPPPVSTTSTAPSAPPDEAAPSVSGGVKPASGFTPGAPREVGEGLSPWETPPPVNFVTGLLLDESLDFSADIERVDALLDDFPPLLTLALLEPPELLTFTGVLDAEQVETTQPFAARTISRDDGLEVGELWLIASGGSAAGDDYLAAARNRWDVDAAVDQFAPEVGVRLYLLGADDTTHLWASDVEDNSIVLIQAPAAMDPQLLVDALRAWRRSTS